MPVGSRRRARSARSGMLWARASRLVPYGAGGGLLRNRSMSSLGFTASLPSERWRSPGGKAEVQGNGAGGEQVGVVIHAGEVVGDGPADETGEQVHDSEGECSDLDRGGGRGVEISSAGMNGCHRGLL